MIALVALAGGLGAVARAEVGAVVARRAADPAWGTATVNLVGAAALAALVATGVGEGVGDVLGGGFLGGFTTFSTWKTDALRPDPEGPARVTWTRIAAVVGGQATAGLALVWLLVA